MKLKQSSRLGTKIDPFLCDYITIEFAGATPESVGMPDWTFLLNGERAAGIPFNRDAFSVPNGTQGPSSFYIFPTGNITGLALFEVRALIKDRIYRERVYVDLDRQPTPTEDRSKLLRMLRTSAQVIVSGIEKLLKGS